jgi:hypothetical protein
MLYVKPFLHSIFRLVELCYLIKFSKKNKPVDILPFVFIYGTTSYLLINLYNYSLFSLGNIVRIYYSLGHAYCAVASYLLHLFHILSGLVFLLFVDVLYFNPSSDPNRSWPFHRVFYGNLILKWDLPKNISMNGFYVFFFFSKFFSSL